MQNFSNCYTLATHIFVPQTHTPTRRHSLSFTLAPVIHRMLFDNRNIYDYK